MGNNIEAKSSWKELKEYFSKKSMMEILGVDRDENAHSKFLGWLFEKPEALTLLLTLLNKTPKKNKQPSCAPILNVEGIKKIFSITEDFFIINEEKRRADILITVYPKENEQPFYIVIENKVYSDEHTKQTSAYFEHYQKKYDGRVFFVFLTLPKRLCLSKQKTTEPECQEFIPITYQDIMSHVLDKLNKDDLVDDYIQCLGISYWQEKKAMAYSKDFVDLLNSYWKNCKSQIMQFCQVDEEYSEELIETWNEHSDFLRTTIKSLAGMPVDVFNGSVNEHDFICTLNDVVNGKDFTKYVIVERSGAKSEPLGKQDLIYYLVSRYVKERKNNKLATDFGILTNVFNETWRMRPGSHKGTLTNQIVIDKKRYDDEVKNETNWKQLDGLDIWVLHTLWDGKELMRKVIEKVKGIEGLRDLKITEQDDLDKVRIRLMSKDKKQSN